MYDENFYNAQKSESYESAKNMLGIIYAQIIKPKSVVDVGCGVGTWLRPWQNLANNDGKECEILGIDGNEVGDELFYIDRKYFKRLDLTAPAKKNLKELGDKKFELAQCLEVGEHFSEEYAENFASFLCSLSDLLLFSGAIPHQGGTHHVNCREPAYWAELFARHDFACFDILRQPLWQHGGIAYYYRQNAVLYAKGQAKERLENLGFKSVDKPLYIIHPQMWELRNREFSRIYQAYLRLSADLVELKGISGGKFS